MIGPHVSRTSDHNIQREIARINGWGSIQTMFGNNQSFDIPPSMLSTYTETNFNPLWFYHAPYTASVNPNERSREGCANLIRAMLKYGRKFHIEAIVIHTGGVVGKLVDNVLDGMEDFFENWGVRDALSRGNTKIAVEIGASTCGFNLEPYRFAERYHNQIGYCLDLAHSPAAGCGWGVLRDTIEKYPPIVAHVNFPGSLFGSSQDIHSWRTKPELVMIKKKICIRDNTAVKNVTKEYDETLHLLHSLNVPMIVEGSSFPGCTIEEEINTIKKILGV